MKVIEGDLLALALAGKFDVIVHGCNCFCTMQDGIAKTIKSVFPEAYKKDTETKFGDKGKLGNFSAVSITRDPITFIIINAYTQYDYRNGGKLVDYRAIESVFSRIRSAYSGLRIGFPQIGAGLGGGDWKIISKIIENALKGEDYTLVKFSSP
ncbi:TPA: macro domain-containing protein [Yersinia enterocolitica]|uniref:macro domain-containing protein n=1 Tax=Yersinia enterocolitica TaxID=630 RepID=UPI003708C98C